MTSHRLLYIGRLPLETKRGASAVLIRRHLQRLAKGKWDVRCIYTEPVSSVEPDTVFKEYSISLKKWYYPPKRQWIPASAKVRKFLIKKQIRGRLGTWQPDIVAVFSQDVPPLLFECVSDLYEAPQVSWLHDTIASPRDYNSVADGLRAILSRSSHCWTVSDLGAKAARGFGAAKATTILPIPAAISQLMPTPPQNSDLVVAILGSIGDSIEVVKKTCAVVANLGGKALLLSNDRYYPTIAAIIQTEHISWLAPADAVRTVASKANFILIPYPFPTFGHNEQPSFLHQSFPSRFVEFSAAGLPFLVVAPENFTFTRWLRENSSVPVVTKLDEKQLASMVKTFLDRTTWVEQQEETSRLRSEFFCPEVLQQQFENELLQVLAS
jgi:hypothetical protein